MGKTYVTATLTGSKATKDYSFLVDTGSSFIGLPSAEIEELGLTPIPGGRVRVLTATGVIEQSTYTALGRVQGQGFSATIIPAPIPLVGYELLQNLRFRVNPVTEGLEEVSPDEPHPPFLL